MASTYVRDAPSVKEEQGDLGAVAGRSSRPFRVLSLDGGGMRGVYASTYLGELAEAFARKRRVPALDVGKGFDLIVGTSTGGIVACALAAGVPLRDVVALYRERGAAIFPMKLPTRFRFSLITQLFTRPAALASGARALREVLEARFGNETLEEVYTRRPPTSSTPSVIISVISRLSAGGDGTDPLLLDLSGLEHGTTGDRHDGKVGGDSSSNGDEKEAIGPAFLPTAR